MTYGRHIYANKYDMAKSTMYAYSHSDHALPHWKCVLLFCAKCPSINLTNQEQMISIPTQVIQFFFTFII